MALALLDHPWSQAGELIGHVLQYCAAGDASATSFPWRRFPELEFVLFELQVWHSSKKLVPARDWGGLPSNVLTHILAMGALLVLVKPRTWTALPLLD